MTAPNRIPFDLEAERDVLASVMIFPDEAFGIVKDTLSTNGGDFYSDLHARIWRAIAAAERAAEPIDSVSVAARLSQDEEHETLLALTGRLTSPQTVEARCKRIRDLAACRAVFTRAMELAASAHQAVDDPAAWLDVAEGALTTAAAARFEDGVFVPLSTAVEASVTRLTEHAERGGGIQGHASGLVDLDRVLSGWCDGLYYVIAGRPGSGKSAVAKDIAMGIVRSSGQPGLFASLEMPLVEVGDRVIVSSAKVDYERYRTGKTTREEMGAAMAAANEAYDLPLYVSETPGMSLDTIVRWAWRLKRKHGRLSCVVIDYLQLMGGRFARGTSREERVSENSKGIKTACKQLGCPFVVLSQLNRGVESRQDKRPVISDLRESGSIEQDADCIVLLYRDGDTIEANVGKQRAGRTGTIPLRWFGSQVRVENAARQPDRIPTAKNIDNERRYWDD